MERTNLHSSMVRLEIQKAVSTAIKIQRFTFQYG